MAVYRQTPKCLVCGKPTYEAIYRIPDKILGDVYIGDTFSHWKAIPCKCGNNQNSINPETNIFTWTAKKN